MEKAKASQEYGEEGNVRKESCYPRITYQRICCRVPIVFSVMVLFWNVQSGPCESPPDFTINAPPV